MHTELVYMFAHSIHFVSCLKELGYTVAPETKQVVSIYIPNRSSSLAEFLQTSIVTIPSTYAADGPHIHR